MGVWQREKGDPKDRLFSFSPAQGSAAGRYFIKFARDYHWGVNAIEMTGKIEARSRADHFELKNVGGDRWKIYYKPGVIVCLDKPTAKNGTSWCSGHHMRAYRVGLLRRRHVEVVHSRPPGAAPAVKITLDEALRNRTLRVSISGAAGKFTYRERERTDQPILTGYPARREWTAIKKIVDAACNNKGYGGETGHAEGGFGGPCESRR